jgi:hypothetical protein
MAEEDYDTHLLIFLPVIIFLITTIGGSMALNVPINETNYSLNSTLEDNSNFIYPIKIIDNENDSQSKKIKNNYIETFKDKNESDIKNIPPEIVQAAPENVSQNNVTILDSNQVNDSSSLKWNLNGTKTVYLTSDNIIDKNTDMKFLKRMEYDLERNGINVIIDPYAPNPNQVPRSIKNAPKDSAVVVINFNCAGTIKDLTIGISGPQTNGKTEEGYLYGQARDLKGIVYVNVSPDTILANCSYLPRAYDDDFSPGSFKGLTKPAEYLLENGITLIDNIQPVYPIMGLERADTVSNRLLTLIK